MWDLPGPGLEPVSPALVGGFLTTAPPGKSLFLIFWGTSILFSIAAAPFYSPDVCRYQFTLLNVTLSKTVILSKNANPASLPSHSSVAPLTISNAAVFYCFTLSVAHRAGLSICFFAVASAIPGSYHMHMERECKCGEELTTGESRWRGYEYALYYSSNFSVDLKCFKIKSWGRRTHQASLAQLLPLTWANARQSLRKRNNGHDRQPRPEHLRPRHCMGCSAGGCQREALTFLRTCVLDWDQGLCW